MSPKSDALTPEAFPRKYRTGNQKRDLQKSSKKIRTADSASLKTRDNSRKDLLLKRKMTLERLKRLLPPNLNFDTSSGKWKVVPNEILYYPGLQSPRYISTASILGTNNYDNWAAIARAITIGPRPPSVRIAADATPLQASDFPDDEDAQQLFSPLSEVALTPAEIQKGAGIVKGEVSLGTEDPNVIWLYADAENYVGYSTDPDTTNISVNVTQTYAYKVQARPYLSIVKITPKFTTYGIIARGPHENFVDWPSSAGATEVKASLTAEAYQRSNGVWQRVDDHQGSYYNLIPNEFWQNIGSDQSFWIENFFYTPEFYALAEPSPLFIRIVVNVKISKPHDGLGGILFDFKKERNYFGIRTDSIVTLNV